MTAKRVLKNALSQSAYKLTMEVFEPYKKFSQKSTNHETKLPQSLSTHCKLLITHCNLPIAYCLFAYLPIENCPLQIAY